MEKDDADIDENQEMACQVFKEVKRFLNEDC